MLDQAIVLAGYAIMLDLGLGWEISYALDQEIVLVGVGKMSDSADYARVTISSFFNKQKVGDRGMRTYILR